MKPSLDVADVRAWFATAEDEEIEAFLEDGLGEIILDFESEDYFGTEGFNKRFA